MEHNGDNLLLQAIYCLTLYSLQNRKGMKPLKIRNEDYTIEDAFKEVFNRKQRLHPAPMLIPSPS